MNSLPTPQSSIRIRFDVSCKMEGCEAGGWSKNLVVVEKNSRARARCVPRAEGAGAGPTGEGGVGFPRVSAEKIFLFTPVFARI